MAWKSDPETRRRWQERIERQQAGDLTVAEFARKEGISAASFYAWKRRLAGKAPSAARTRKRRRPSPAAPAPEPFVQLPVPDVSAAPWIELALIEGTIIRIPQQNLAALQTVLQVLRTTVQPRPIREG